MIVKRKRSLVLLLALVLLVHARSLGQSALSSKSKKAIAYYHESDNYRVRRQYDQAIDLLRLAIAKDQKFVEAYIRLGKIYHTIDNLELAEESYQAAITLAPSDTRHTAVYLSIGEIQVTMEKYERAKKNLQKYIAGKRQNQKPNQLATLLIDQADYALEHINSPVDFAPVALASHVNQFELQYFPAITADQQTLLFTKRNGNSPYDDEDIMVSYKDDKEQWGEPISISSHINTQQNEGTCAISADGRTLVFTSCQGRKGYGSCDLYISHKSGDEWSDPQNMGGNINTSAWESQPTLSSDGRKLYFVSNRKGGVGGRDIWESNLINGSWSRPVNLGDQINTRDEEVSPFIHQNGKVLYFASNGKPGFGGFDIYSTELTADKVWTPAENIGYPINRGNDQMSIIITADGSTGYYSDSGGQQGKTSVIRQFTIPEQIRAKHKSFYVKGVIKDAETENLLRAKIQLYNIKTNELLQQTSSDSIYGDYLITLSEGGKYSLYVDKPGYVFKSLNFNMSVVDDYRPVKIDVSLHPIKKGTVATLNNIFFTHDSFELSKESITELNKVAEFIQGNNVALEIRGYTDATGSADYNLKLSANRAKAVYNYLVNNYDIPQNKLSYKGYGIAKDDDITGRRIEFVIVQ